MGKPFELILLCKLGFSIRSYQIPIKFDSAIYPAVWFEANRFMESFYLFFFSCFLFLPRSGLDTRIDNSFCLISNIPEGKLMRNTR